MTGGLFHLQICARLPGMPVGWYWVHEWNQPDKVLVGVARFPTELTQDEIKKVMHVVCATGMVIGFHAYPVDEQLDKAQIPDNIKQLLKME